MKKIFLLNLIVVMVLLLTTLTESYAFSTNGIVVKNDVYVIKYGKEISLDKGETVTCSNSKIDITTEKIKVNDNGYFTLKTDSKEIKCFSWNVILLSGTYALYGNSTAETQVAEITGPVYLSVETVSSTVLKILDYYAPDGVNRDYIKNKYLTNYYDVETLGAKTNSFEYSFLTEEQVKDYLESLSGGTTIATTPIREGKYEKQSPFTASNGVTVEYWAFLPSDLGKYKEPIHVYFWDTIGHTGYYNVHGLLGALHYGKIKKASRNRNCTRYRIKQFIYRCIYKSG